jgi:adenosylcobyric acid synthase
VLDHSATSGGGLAIAVPMLSRIANFDDFDPLRHEPGVNLVMVPPGTPLPADAALVILPGTKATIADLKFFREQGWDIDLAAHVRRGGRVLGICGGYQMLGVRIEDPEGFEGAPETIAGLGYLPVSTKLTGDKRVTRTQGVELKSGLPFEGYEIHAGRTFAEGSVTPLLRFSDGALDGAITADGRIAGCYVHGLFNRAEQRAAWLARIGSASNGMHHAARVDAALDALAVELERAIDVERLIDISVQPPRE